MAKKDEKDDIKTLARDPYMLGRSGKFKSPPPPMKVPSSDLAGRTGK